MSEKSILDQIINNHKAEEVANLDAVEIINNLFNELNERERDVIVRRYGLQGEGKETLESIGTRHSLTRERIRQIETTSIKKLQQLKNLENYINNLKKVIIQLLEEHGGMVERDYMLDMLVHFSLEGYKREIENILIHKNYLDFLITKLLFNEFEEVINSRNFKSSYKLKFQDLEHLEQITENILEKISEDKKIFRTDELINLIKNLEKYKQHQEKLNTRSSLDISNVLKSNLFEEKHEVINEHKPLFSILKAAKKIEQNKFGHWGRIDWNHIIPKTINDKIFLVLKNHNKPMHFVEIADRINVVEFDRKKANPATVHNELILDDKYVLIGRGIYGLKDWGYKEGTVAQVIEEILRNEDKPLSRDEIMERVLEKRMVKKATVVLALMNKDKFKRADGKYTLNK